MDKKVNNRLLKIILIIMGSIFTSLGVIGIFLPLMPTTVFLIMAAACYVRSSDKLYQWLLNNKWFGEHLKNYLEHKAMPLKAKMIAIPMMWITISYSAYAVPLIAVKIVLIIIAISVTAYILSIKTLQE